MDEDQEGGVSGTLELGHVLLPPGIAPDELQALFADLYDGLPDADESDGLTPEAAERWAANVTVFVQGLIGHWLGLLTVDQDPMLSAVILEGPVDGVYVQFGRYNAERAPIPYEAVGNRFLQAPRRLGAVEEAQLIALGFQVPLDVEVKGVVIGPNWFQEIDTNAWTPGKMACHALATLGQVYGVRASAVTLTPVWDRRGSAAPAEDDATGADGDGGGEPEGEHEPPV